MWECSCVDCVCPVSSVQRHDLIWVPAIFPQGMLEAVALVGDEARDGETKAWTDCEAGLLCSVASLWY